MTSASALVAQTAAAIGGIGAKYYFDPATIAAGKAIGLDGFRFYVLGRGGVLGNVEPAVITSAFGYFHPNTIAKMWNSGREIIEPRDAARAALGANAALGRQKLAGVAGLTEFCAAAEQVVADVNPAGLALYAGIAAEPLPDDVAGRAMQLCCVHRELRGSAHLAAVITAGIHPGVAHAIRRPTDVQTFGWTEEIAITDDDRARLAEVDVRTDALSAQHYSSISDDQRTAFVAGVNAINAAFA